jgi:hypothetical protein
MPPGMKFEFVLGRRREEIEDVLGSPIKGSPKKERMSVEHKEMISIDPSLLHKLVEENQILLHQNNEMYDNLMCTR